MPVSTRAGDFSRTAANAGIPLVEIPTSGGGAGPGPDIVIVIISMALGSDYASDPTITLQLFPSTDFTQGTDVNGNISVLETFTRISETEWSSPSGGTMIFEDGIMNQSFRAVTNLPTSVQPEISYNIQLNCFDLSTYSEDPSIETPTDIDSEGLSYDEEIEEGEVSITFTATDEDADGYVLQLSENVPGDWFDWAVIPRIDGQNQYEIKDWAFGPIPQTWVYRIVAYKEDGELKSTPSAEVTVTWDGDLPDIDIVGSGGIDFGGTATIVLQGDPSGLYTLVPGKTNDTLYERAGAEDTTDVKIPNPFFKTGFLT